MKIAVAKEIDPSEPRVAVSPDTVKKYKALGVDVAIEPGAGLKSGLPVRNSPRSEPPSAPMRSRTPTSLSR